MSSKIKSPEDFWAGLMFIGFGILAIVVASDYPLGSAKRMGPGYFPTYIGAILILLGAIITGVSFKSVGEGVGKFAWRPMILLPLAFAVFGWAIDNIGFILALVFLIVVSSLAGKEFTLVVVAAFLTIIGYSLNDTIVVFDRIRENIARMPKSPLEKIINQSINESLSRTILTSVTTFLVVLTLFIWGGQIIHDFCFAMIIGLIVGTYSSVFVASPVVLAMDKRNR